MRIASAAFSLLAVTSAGCGGSGATAPDAQISPPDMAVAPDLAPSPAAACAAMKLTVRPFDTSGNAGGVVERNDVAPDFTLTDQNGPFHLRDQFSGCDSYVFIPDDVPVSADDSDSIWNTDLDALLAASPPNVHYFFVSRAAQSMVPTRLALISSQVDAAVAELPPGDGPGQQGWWRSRLHLVQGTGKNIDGFIGELLRASASTSPVGPYGFAIDRFQRIRGVGSYADVTRFDSQLQSQMQWPWQNDMAYAANPPIYFNYESDRQDRLDAEQSPTVVTAWDHEMLNLTVEKDVTLPAASAFSAFDRLEVDVLMECPDPTKAEEANNCGAWDYIVELDVLDADGMTYREVARFISTYHRAGRWVVDATHALPLLASGGSHHFRFVVSPPWNAQTYDTTMQLRFVNTGSGMHPAQTVSLFGGGNFDTTYDMSRTPAMVPIPANAKKVELRALITGHGADTAKTCAEFCDDTHQFTVTGPSASHVYTKDYPMAGTDDGCMAQIGDGVVPNQSGTWWLGRQGWCPGAQVDPWVSDVTAQAMAGQTVAVTYQGLVGGKPPTMSLGNIDMSSWLVVWE